MRCATILLPLLIIGLVTECSALSDALINKLKQSYDRTRSYFQGVFGKMVTKIYSIIKEDPKDAQPLNLNDTSNANETITSDLIWTHWSEAPGTPHIVKFHEYPFESHNVVTADGYILSVHRIPYSRNNLLGVVPEQTVLLHHGLLGSSVDWVVAGPNRSLGFMLADAGYDVWMANMRGNVYSKNHIKWSISSRRFWDFSFHEVSQRDLPAVIDYILFVKSATYKINYVGHSMGATVLFALLATRPSYKDQLIYGVALAPVAFMADIKSPLRCMSRYSDDLQFMHKVFGVHEFLPSKEVLKWVSDMLCEFHHYSKLICDNSLFVLCGFNEMQFNRSMLATVLSHYPAGTSTKNVIHFAQMAGSGQFRMFDYGRKRNKLHYDGSIVPPTYKLENVQLPITLITSKSDWLSTTNDSIKLHSKLNNSILFEVPVSTFYHLDFLWGIDAPSLVYKKVIGILHTFNLITPPSDVLSTFSSQVTTPSKNTKDPKKQTVYKASEIKRQPEISYSDAEISFAYSDLDEIAT